MNKIITAKDILKQKGYVQNKFDANGLINIVAEMFMKLSINGCITIKGIRFVDNNIPLDIANKNAGFYFLNKGYEEIQCQYKKLINEHAKIKQNLDFSEKLYDKKEDELFDKVWNQTQWFFSRTIQNWHPTEQQKKFSMLEVLTEGIKEIEQRKAYNNNYENALSLLTRSIQSFMDKYSNLPKVKISNAFIYMMTKKLQNGDKLLAQLETCCMQYYELLDKENSLELELEDYQEDNKVILDMKPFTIYIDQPFFNNAANVLKMIGGYVVQRRESHGVPYYEVMLI